MSRIGGIVRKNGHDSNEAIARSLLSILRDRGPDSEGVWTATDVSLCHASLQTTPEAKLEEQPTSNRRDTTVCTADIRIDNRDKLVKRLHLTDGGQYRLSDPEILLEAYKEWGLELTQYLIGDFSFAIWDVSRKRLFCSRDAMGIRPFYYCKDDSFLFSSEVKPLLENSKKHKRGTNEDKIFSYLRGELRFEKSTFYDNIYRLLPGHSMVVNIDGRVCEWQYWSPENDLSPLKLKDDREYEEAFREVFKKSVSSCLRSSSKVGFMLSGGLDSSAVLRGALEFKGGTSPDDCVVYSGVYPSYTDESTLIDESTYIKDVIKKYNIRKRNIISDKISPINGVEDVLKIKSEPFQARGHYRMWEIGKKSVKDDVNVMMSGMGGDVVVGYGYEHINMLASNKMWGEFSRVASNLERNCRKEDLEYSEEKVFYRFGLSAIVKLVQEGRIRKALSSFAGVISNMNVRKARFLRKLIWRSIPFRMRNGLPLTGSEDYDIAQGKPVMHDDEDTNDGPDSWMRSRIKGLRDSALLEAMESVDPLMSHHRVEARHPFCDRRVVEFCLSVPPDQRIKGGWPRSLLRRAMGHHLPKSVARRLSKGQLGAAIARNLLKFESEKIEHVLQDEGIAPYVDKKAARQAYQRLQQSPSLGGDAERLIRCIILSMWLQD